MFFAMPDLEEGAVLGRFSGHDEQPLREDGDGDEPPPQRPRLA
jgi:hypothetical protein